MKRYTGFQYKARTRSSASFGNPQDAACKRVSWVEGNRPSGPPIAVSVSHGIHAIIERLSPASSDNLTHQQRIRELTWRAHGPASDYDPSCSSCGSHSD